MIGRRAALAALLLLVAAGCSDDQDPGITPGTTTGGPSTTSQVLAPCPAGGPDATTSPAGCLDEDGAVVRP